MSHVTFYDVLAYVLIGFTIIGAIIFLMIMIPAVREASSSSYGRPQTARPPKRVCKYTGSCCSKRMCKYTGPCWSTEDMRRFRNEVGDYAVRKFYEDRRKEQEKQLYASMLEELRRK